MQRTFIPSLSNVRQLASTGGTMFALMADGTVKAWGQDELALLGNGVSRPTARPTLVPGLNRIASIVASGPVGVRMLTMDGVALKWGAYQDTVFSPVAVAVPERVRHMAERNGQFSIMFGSGRIGRELNDPFDQSLRFR